MANSRLLIGLFIFVAAISRVRSTCVFESDFGFKLNCAFKKSSLFRVRNLGGIKAHVGLGFSVGDELGFDQSLTNLDTSKRRSVGFQNGSPYNSLSSSQSQQKTTRTNKNRLTVRQPSTTLATTIAEEMETERPLQSGRSQASVRQMSMTKGAVPPFKPIPPAQEMAGPTLRSPYPPQSQSQRTVQVNRMGQTANSVNLSVPPLRVAGHSSGEALRTIPAPVMTQVPKFAAMPSSISRIQDQPSMSVVNSQAYKNSVQIPMSSPMNRMPNMGFQSLSLNKVQPTQRPIYSQIQELTKPSQKIDNMVQYNFVSGQDYSAQTSLQQKIAALSKATNISMETIEAAVRLRQSQILQQMLSPAPAPTKVTRASPTTTTTSTTPRPPPKRYQPPPPPANQNPPSKVMNAPKEYYPVGYDKNFDDNFISKVDLPETSFYCGDQKHFPGLYGDEDLGCMVFHVCALTDDGLIMKSFLCPESTLFDQTILKCNWWFYVDCKSSKKLYDSNIPISKSYQLMKALTFFSSYKKEMQGDQSAAEPAIVENTEGVNNAVKIFQNQASTQLPKVEIVEVNKTSHPVRNSKYFTPVDAEEVNSLSTSVVAEENVSGEVVEKPAEVTKPTEVITSSETPSTSTSVQTSSSVERKYRRRPSASFRVVAPSTTTVVTTTEEKRRIERSSEEDDDDDTTKSPIIVVPEETRVYPALVEVEYPPEVKKTIEMMDEAIIGRKTT